MANYDALKAYIDEHDHLPPKNAPLDAKYEEDKRQHQLLRMQRRNRETRDLNGRQRGGES